MWLATPQLAVLACNPTGCSRPWTIWRRPCHDDRQYPVLDRFFYLSTLQKTRRPTQHEYRALSRAFRNRGDSQSDELRGLAERARWIGPRKSFGFRLFRRRILATVVHS